MICDGASDREVVRFLIDVETSRMGLADRTPVESDERRGRVVPAFRYVGELDGS